MSHASPTGRRADQQAPGPSAPPSVPQQISASHTSFKRFSLDVFKTRGGLGGGWSVGYNRREIQARNGDRLRESYDSPFHPEGGQVVPGHPKYFSKEELAEEWDRAFRIFHTLTGPYKQEDMSYVYETATSSLVARCKPPEPGDGSCEVNAHEHIPGLAYFTFVTTLAARSIEGAPGQQLAFGELPGVVEATVGVYRRMEVSFPNFPFFAPRPWTRAELQELTRNPAYRSRNLVTYDPGCVIHQDCFEIRSKRNLSDQTPTSRHQLRWHLKEVNIGYVNSNGEDWYDCVTAVDQLYSHFRENNRGALLLPLCPVQYHRKDTSVSWEKNFKLVATPRTSILGPEERPKALYHFKFEVLSKPDGTSPPVVHWTSELVTSSQDPLKTTVIKPAATARSLTPEQKQKMTWWVTMWMDIFLLNLMTSSLYRENRGIQAIAKGNPNVPGGAPM
ncbi:hypothetical protein NMY22_g13955 [Coprinellus aureogranulatus]|nr:hypothetical protein NMY22_g13955 [Coprinellus aureogranulatus]